MRNKEKIIEYTSRYIVYDDLDGNSIDELAYTPDFLKSIISNHPELKDTIKEDALDTKQIRLDLLADEGYDDESLEEESEKIDERLNDVMNW